MSRCQLLHERMQLPGAEAGAQLAEEGRRLAQLQALTLQSRQRAAGLTPRR